MSGLAKLLAILKLPYFAHVPCLSLLIFQHGG